MLDTKYTKWFPDLTIESLNKYGDCKIVKLFIGKHDICNKFLRYTFMNILSDGLWSKQLIKMNVNKLQHTYIICQIICNDEELDIVISKEFSFICSTLSFYVTSNSIKKNILEITAFDKEINITINTLLEQTIKNIGDEKFFIWTPWSSCQDFSKDILVTIDAINYKRILYNKSINKQINNIRVYDTEVNKFVVQNVDGIIKEMPDRIRTFMDSYTICMKKLYNIT